MKYPCKVISGVAPLILFCALVLLAGCAEQTQHYGEQIAKVNYYAMCYKPIGDLRAEEKLANEQAKKDVGSKILTGQAITGLLSTPAAALARFAGSMEGNDPREPLAGASRLYQEKQYIVDNMERLQSYRLDMEKYDRDIDHVYDSVSQAASCYEREYKALTTQIRKGRETYLAASERLDEIASGMRDSLNLVAKFQQYLAELTRELKGALFSERHYFANPVLLSKNSPGAIAAYQKVIQNRDTYMRYLDGLDADYSKFEARDAKISALRERLLKFTDKYTEDLGKFLSR